jgi:hypothetical protein
MIGTEDGYWFSFDEKQGIYSIHHYDREVDYGRADNIEGVQEWFDRFVARARAETVS